MAAISKFYSNPEVDFENKNVTDVNAFYGERMPLEFWKSVQQLSSYRDYQVFGGHFDFLIHFLRINVTDVNAFYGEHIPLEFWKSVLQFSTYRKNLDFGGHFKFSQANRK